jgi:hypothetical protein
MRRRQSTQYAKPRWIKAKFASVCPQTGDAIQKGDECLYFPVERKVVHVNSPDAKDWRSQNEADSLCLGDAGW